jgi:hypothetical protein
MKTIRHLFVVLAIAMLPLLFSCEFTSTDQNDIKIFVLCSGSSCIEKIATTPTVVYGAAFTVSYILDDNLPLSQGPTSKFISFQPNDTAKPPDLSLGGDCFSVYPAGNIKKATITITKDSAATDASITLMIYNNGEADKNGYGSLPSCTAGTSTTCTNTLTLQYEVKSSDETDSTAAKTTTTSSSTSSSSTQ